MEKHKIQFRPTPAFHDTLIIIVTGIITFIIASIFSLHRIFDETLKGIKVAGVSGEELPILFAILMLCLAAFSVRRWLETRSEVSRRIVAEESLKRHQNQLEELVIERTRKILELHKQVEFILNATKTGLDIIDSDYNIVYIDSGWQKVYGDPDDKKCYEYFMGRDSVCPNCGVAKAFETKKMVVTEEVLVREGNRPVQVTTIPYKNENGEWLVAEVNVDITERKKLDGELRNYRDHLEDVIKKRSKELADSEERFRLIFSGATDGLILVDIDTKRFSMANRSICSILGYSEEEMKVLSVKDIHPVDSLSHVLEQFENLVKKEIKVAVSVPVKRKDDTVFYADITASPVRLLGKEYVMGSFRDITERRMAEDALQTSEANYRSIFELASDAIMIRDVETYETIDANRAACEMFGYSKEEMLGLHIKDFMTAEEHYKWEDARHFYEKALAGEPQLFEWLAVDKVGRSFWVEATVKRAVIGGRYRLMSMLRDITERKKIGSMRDNFVNMVSHELRTPLGAIKESVSLLSEGAIGPVDKRQMEVIDVAKRNVDRLKRLIDQVLDLQKIDAGKMELKIEPNNINEIITEVHRTMLSLASKSKLHFTLKLDETLPYVNCDRDKIIEVLINLINNAIKFTPKGGMTITTGSGNNFIQVSIADTGRGIKAEDMPKLFQRFAQLERKAGGTGLGLAISKEIVELHKGKLWAESEFGKGTTFHFILPIKERRR